MALAQNAPDYKALVCVFQLGGNDGENTLIRYDSAGYQNYAAIRTPALEPQHPAGAVAAHPAGARGTAIRLSPRVCAPAGPLRSEEARRGRQRRDAGAAVRKARYRRGDDAAARQPVFAHRPGCLRFKAPIITGFTRVGWGGRMADRFDAANPGTLFPPLTSVNGLQTFVFGHTSIPLTVPPNPNFTLSSSGQNQFQFDVLRDAALKEILAQDQTNIYDVVAQVLSEEGLAAASVVYPDFAEPQLHRAADFRESHVADGCAIQDHCPADRRPGTDTTQAADFLRATNGLRHAWQSGAHSTGVARRTEPGQSSAFQIRYERAGPGQQRDDVHVVRIRPDVQARRQPGHRSWLGQLRVCGGWCGARGRFLWNASNTGVERPRRLRQRGSLDSRRRRWSNTAPRWLAGSALPKSDLPYVFPNIRSFANTNLGFMT